MFILLYLMPLCVHLVYSFKTNNKSIMHKDRVHMLGKIVFSQNTFSGKDGLVLYFCRSLLCLVLIEHSFLCACFSLQFIRSWLDAEAPASHSYVVQ